MKGLDRHNKRAISALDWHAAAKAAEDCICFHHREGRAMVFAAHHRIVMDLGQTHGWDIAMEYNTQQRELAALNLKHDLSSLDAIGLTLIATKPLPTVAAPQSSPPSPKHPLSTDTSMAPAKKQLCLHCFHCGSPGHLPSNCRAATTMAGRPTAPVTTNGKGKNTLLAPSGKQFCFSWAKGSSCSFGDT